MIQKVDYRFSIKNETGSYYYVDNAGIVQIDISPRYLTFAPDGWNDILLNWQREFVFFGIMRSFTMPLKFVGDGAKILKNIYYLNGVQGGAMLSIDKFNSDHLVYDYENIYVGDLDLSQIIDLQNEHVTCNVMEGGFVADFFAKNGIDYEIDIDSHANKVFVKLDGIELFGTFNYEIQPSTIFGSPAIGNAAAKAYIQNVFINNEGAFNLLVGESQIEQLLNSPGDINNFFLYNGNITQSVDIICALDVEVNVFGVLQFPAQSTAIKCILIEIDENGNDTTNAVLDSHVCTMTTSGSNLFNYTININTSVILNPKCKYQIAFYSDVIQNGATTSWLIDVQNATPFYVKSTYTKGTSYIPALRPIDVLKEVVLKMSPSFNPTVISSNLSTVNNTKVITCGDAIRGLSGSKIKINLLDLHKSFNALMSTGIHYKQSTNTLYYEALNGFIFENTNMVDIGEVDNFKVTPATEFMFNKLVSGYKSQNYEDVNGRNEFNQKTEFESHLTRVKSTKDLSSVIRADCYGIEFTRLNFEGKTTTDADSDNDNFFIDLASTFTTITNPFTGSGTIDVYEAYKNNTWTYTGLLTPSTIFNARITPKRNLFANGDYLASCMNPSFANEFKFTSGNKNTAVTIDDGSMVYAENANEIISDLGTPFFIPIFFTFKTRNLSTIQIIVNNPLGYITFQYKGVDYYGYVLKISDNPTLVREQEFKLLATTANTLSTLL